MLSRSQRFRKLRHRARDEGQRVRAPLSLFEEGSGELLVQQARLHKSFSDQGPHTEVAEAPRMKRSVSDNFTTSRRSLFSSSQAAAVVTAMPAGPAVGDGATAVVATAVPVEQKRSRCRAVNFHERVAVVLIPAAKDMQQEDKSTLWWTRNELQTFQRELVRALPPNTNLRQNILSLGELAAFAGCDFSAPFALCEPLQEVCKSAVAVPAKAVHCAAAANSSSSAEATAVVAVSITAALAVLDLNGRGASSCLPAAAHTVAV
jgi:hypothetical protein